VFDPSFIVGVDLVHVGDVSESLARFGDRYTNRLFTEREIAYCAEVPHLAAERFAARFAAKEATMKVLRPTATDVVPWRSIEVLRSADGWCEIALRDAAATLARQRGIAWLSLSMSHEREYATAMVAAGRGTAVPT
jgi:holo-[acyl-carrier protein] synthase